MGLQKHILVFIRSQIQQEFVAYVASLQSLMKYIFAFDRTHHERWLSVDISDLLRLQHLLPGVFKEFLKNHRVAYKTSNIFSGIAFDQAHEQFNAKVKPQSGGLNLLNRDDSGDTLLKWTVSSPGLFYRSICITYSIVHNIYLRK